MDKIKAELYELKGELLANQIHYGAEKSELLLKIKSRDEEIKKLKLENRLKYEEIKKLRETLQELVDECNGMISDEDRFCKKF